MALLHVVENLSMTVAYAEAFYRRIKSAKVRKYIYRLIALFRSLDPTLPSPIIRPITFDMRGKSITRYNSVFNPSNDIEYLGQPNLVFMHIKLH